MNYFTDREFGEQPRNHETISKTLWEGLRAEIYKRIIDGSFGYRFPEQCGDGNALCGCDDSAFEAGLKAEIQIDNLNSISNLDNDTATPLILDILEFCATAVGKPRKICYHEYFQHHHLDWDHDEGLAEFVAVVNRLFARNGVAYEMTDEGQIHRTLPKPLARKLSTTLFVTGDRETDKLLEMACQRILSRDEDERREALEKLWDAFERIKTLESGSNKSERANALLDRAASSESKFRKMLSAEAKCLTDIGNSFRIRHSEKEQENLGSLSHVDYLVLAHVCIHLPSAAIKRQN